MYIAKHAEYVVKRMPDTGRQHHPTCPSFEPEPGTSGLGELLGEAIIEHAPDQVEVRTDFAMSRIPGKSVSRGEVVAVPAEVHAPRKTMSLRALLHFLYERAGFNRWYPAMEGRRNQGVLHKYLSEAARGVRLKGAALDERLYVPEPFRAECKDQISERRRKKLALLLSREDAVVFKMAILVGEYNGVRSDGPGTPDQRQAHARRAAAYRDRGMETSGAQLWRHPPGARCGRHEETAHYHGCIDLLEARARLSGGHAQHDVDDRSMDSARWAA